MENLVPTLEQPLVAMAAVHLQLRPAFGRFPLRLVGRAREWALREVGGGVGRGIGGAVGRHCVCVCVCVFECVCVCMCVRARVCVLWRAVELVCSNVTIMGIVGVRSGFVEVRES